MFALWIIVLVIIIKLYNKASAGKCYTDNVMTGQVVLVTEGSSSVGYYTALDLAKRGAKVIITCQDADEGDRAVKSIITATNNSKVRCEQLDISSLDSIRSFVNEFKKHDVKLDIIVLNPATELTRETVMQRCYYGPFLLANLLVPLLNRSCLSRVIVLSSFLHKLGTTEKINEKNCYGLFQSYCNSKLCNILFSNELSRRLEKEGIIVNSVHPGIINAPLLKSTFMNVLRYFVLYAFSKSPEEAAQTAIFLATSDDCCESTGKYYVDCNESGVSKKAGDDALAIELWRLSEKVVQLKPEEYI